MYLKCQAEPKSVILMEPENLHQFHVDCAGHNVWTVDNILNATGAGMIAGSKAWIRYEFLIETGMKAGLSDEWRSGLEKMIAYAEGKGWVLRNPDVQISAHLNSVGL